MSKAKPRDIGGVNVVDHSIHPSTAVQGLIPELLSESPAVRSAPTITPSDLVQTAITKGGIVKDVPINLYPSPNSTGFPRKLDNSDLIRGYAPLYTDISHLIDVSNDVIDWIDHFRGALDRHGNDHLTSMENEDLKKICMQRTKYPGYHLELPFSPDIKLDGYPVDFYRTMEEMVGAYAKAVPKEVLGMSLAQTSPLIIDRTESMVGLPTQVSGPAQSQEARYATLKAMPPLDQSTMTPEAYLDSLSKMSQRLGAPEDLMYSVMLSTRSGPTNKFQRFWSGGAGSWASSYELKGFYNRTRHVYPAPYQVNFILSKLYYQMKRARMNILGMWHDIDSQNEYIEKSAKQGKYAYTGDFSGMDNHYSPHILKTFLQLLRKKGFDPWGTRFLELIIDNMSVYVPSFTVPGTTTAFQKVFGWFSGSQLTAEMNCLLGVSTVGYCIKQQNPSFWKGWLEGSKIIMNLGDDIQFTDDFQYDKDRWALSANEVGHEMPLSEDTVFLKKILPTGWGITKITKPFSRVVQQGFFNEDSYDDKVNYPAIMLLGLQSRLISLSAHPLFKEGWSKLFPIFMKLNYAQVMTAQQRNDLKTQAYFELSDTNKKEIIDYASKSQAWSSTLLSRSDVQPSALEFLNMLIHNGFNPTDLLVENSKMRALNYEALISTPSQADFDRVMLMKRW